MPTLTAEWLTPDFRNSGFLSREPYNESGLTCSQRVGPNLWRGKNFLGSKPPLFRL
jgi:hypothetical protein